MRFSAPHWPLYKWYFSASESAEKRLRNSTLGSANRLQMKKVKVYTIEREASNDFSVNIYTLSSE